MLTIKSIILPKMRQNQVRKEYLILTFASFLALIFTFAVSLTEFALITKVLSFLIITVVYGAFVIVFYGFQKNKITDFQCETKTSSLELKNELNFSQKKDEKLVFFENAEEIIKSSGSSSDVFRLISNQINQNIPHKTSVLFLASENKKTLKVCLAFGTDAIFFVGREIKSNQGLSGKVFQTSEIEIEKNLQLEKDIIPLESLETLNSAIACPLISNGETYGILTLYSHQKDVFDEQTVILFESIRQRISPIFVNFGNNQTTLIDSITNLPNKNALLLILERQITESARFREERPLTIISIAMKNFAEINQKYGHATGDHILNFVAENIKSQLRQMDSIGRLANDEFLLILPTSNAKTAEKIVQRIQQAFAAKPFIVADKEKVYLHLDFGLAVFGEDGETLDDLLKKSQRRLQENKSPIRSKVLKFPKDYLH